MIYKLIPVLTPIMYLNVFTSECDETLNCLISNNKLGKLPCCKTFDWWYNILAILPLSFFPWKILLRHFVLIFIPNSNITVYFSILLSIQIYDNVFSYFIFFHLVQLIYCCSYTHWNAVHTSQCQWDVYTQFQFLKLGKHTPIIELLRQQEREIETATAWSREY